ALDRRREVAVAALAPRREAPHHRHRRLVGEAREDGRGRDVDAVGPRPGDGEPIGAPGRRQGRPRALRRGPVVAALALALALAAQAGPWFRPAPACGRWAARRPSGSTASPPARADPPAAPA